VKRAGLVVATVFAAVLVLPSATAFACSCAQATVQEAVRAADAVVTAVPVRAHGKGQWSAQDAARFDLVVSAVHKGDVPERLAVHDDPKSCGLGLLVGREHVVFLDQSNGGLVSSNCAGNGLAASGFVADVKALTGPSHSPAAARGAEPGDTAWVYPLVGGSVLALLLAGALVLVLLRGRRR
jgi:hypothetical protein